MFYVLTYDISNDKLRLKVSKHLLVSGCFRLQKSVFVAPNYTNKELKLLKKTVMNLLNCSEKRDTDSFLCFRITPKQLPNIWWQEPKPQISFQKKVSEWI